MQTLNDLPRFMQLRRGNTFLMGPILHAASLTSMIEKMLQRHLGLTKQLCRCWAFVFYDLNFLLLNLLVSGHLGYRGNTRGHCGARLWRRWRNLRLMMRHNFWWPHLVEKFLRFMQALFTNRNGKVDFFVYGWLTRIFIVCDLFVWYDKSAAKKRKIKKTEVTITTA